MPRRKGGKNPIVATVAITKSTSKWCLVPFEVNNNSYIQKLVNLYGTTNNQYNYANRYIVMQYQDSEEQYQDSKDYLLGIHMKNDKNKDMNWSELCKALQALPEFAYIVGNFNINDLLIEKESEKKYPKLEGYYKVIKDDIITNNQTIASIDNIFIKEAAKGQMVDWRVIDYCWVFKRKKVRYSDHNLCYVELEKSGNNN